LQSLVEVAVAGAANDVRCHARIGRDVALSKQHPQGFWRRQNAVYFEAKGLWLSLAQLRMGGNAPAVSAARINGTSVAHDRSLPGPGPLRPPVRRLLAHLSKTRGTMGAQLQLLLSANVSRWTGRHRLPP